MHPGLTNKQRAYVGLRSIQPHWQAVAAAHLQQLPEAFEPLYQSGPHGYHYQWGIVSVIVPADEYFEEFEKQLAAEFPRRLRPLADFQVEGAFLNPEEYFQPFPDQQPVAPYDMRHPRYQLLKAKIMAKLELPATITYDEFSRHFGYPARQELLDLQAALPFDRRKWPKWWG